MVARFRHYPKPLGFLTMFSLTAWLIVKLLTLDLENPEVHGLYHNLFRKGGLFIFNGLTVAYVCFLSLHHKQKHSNFTLPIRI